jgi:hypothetical protein
MPYTSVNGSPYPAPDLRSLNATPSVSDPDYKTAIIAFTRVN